MRQGVPPCPLHAKRHVTRNGHYDDPGRQLWWCTPGGGEAPHAFAGSLPRQAGDPGHTCPSCEADLEEHQGPPSPPTSTCPWVAFPVREAAAALVAVGQGLTYTEATTGMRKRRRGCGRGGRRPRRGFPPSWSATGSRWGPVVAARHAETAWPETVVCCSASLGGTRAQRGPSPWRSPCWPPGSTRRAPPGAGHPWPTGRRCGHRSRRGPRTGLGC